MKSIVENVDKSKLHYYCTIIKAYTYAIEEETKTYNKKVSRLVQKRKEEMDNLFIDYIDAS